MKIDRFLNSDVFLNAIFIVAFWLQTAELQGIQ